uniref:Glutamate-gated chloride channel n=1 Tax=Meloidogyne javanica TaxID=6303 RepID=A0A915MDH9_MELJA
MTICELLENYDPAVRPLGQIPNAERRGPVIVTTSLFVNSISAVSERNMEYVVQFRFQQQWLDERLAFKMSEAADLQQINLARDQPIWIPDSFFQNERSGHYHMLDQENRFVQVDVDGRVTYNRRLTLTLACNMNLLRYPMDVQLCLIDFASYAYTKNDIIYQWDNVGIEISDTANGALPNFEIASLDNDTCDSDTNTGSYSCLRVRLTLRRVFSFFLLQLYIPSAMLVGVSWVSYWIDWKSTAARVPLAIVTLLTMITQSHAINSNLPPVSYAKSIDIWIGGCVVFIFASLIEYAIVNYMGILEEHKQMRKITMNRTRLSNVLGDQVIQNFDEQPIKNLNFPNEKRSLLRKQRKMQVDLRFEDQEDEQTMELSNVNNTNASQEHKELFQNVEPGWTMQDVTDLVYLGQRKRVELVRWCSLLNERGRAERIDIIARILFPLAFALFNGVYLNDVYDQPEII